MDLNTPISEIARENVKIRDKIGKVEIRKWFDELVKSLVNDQTKWLRVTKWIKSEIDKSSKYNQFILFEYRRDKKYEYPLLIGLNLNQFLEYLSSNYKYKVFSYRVNVKNNFFTDCKIQLIRGSEDRVFIEVVINSSRCIIS